jgi:uncharacterized membrane protein
MFNPGMIKARTTFSVIIGLACIALGGAPLLKLKLATSMPVIFSPTIIKVALLIGGLFLLYDSFQIKNPFTGMIKGASILTGLLLAIIGAMPLLVELGWFNKSLPFIATLNIPIGILQGLLIFFGLYLLYDAFILSKQFF